MTSKATADRMREELLRFRSLRQHQEPDSAFNQHFIALQLFQIERMKHTHAALLRDERYQAATEFFLSDMYGGLDLTEMATEIERALPIATRLLPDSVMRTSLIACELNNITQTLDETMTEILFEDMKIDSISNEAYIAAWHKLDARAQRERQFDLIVELGFGLDKYVRSRVIFATFKLANKPAHMAGLGNLYDFLGRGFAVMRPMGSAHEFIQSISDHERRIMDAIDDGYPDPFSL